MPGIFTKIINGEIPCYKIYEDEKFIAFLDIFPLAKGHTLVIPKKETDYIFDMGDGELSEFIVVSKKIARSIEKAVVCKRIGIVVIGLEVPHAHIHLIPVNNISDIDFSRPKLKLSEEVFEEIRDSIIKQIG